MRASITGMEGRVSYRQKRTENGKFSRNWPFLMQWETGKYEWVQKQ